ncbi:KdsC family phosphatase [Ferrovibrio sp.]|uniref:KdsC family phosphatase n=1 Tax=Ferrovibrio sp. TaxID=1917215 RepID=UPI0035B105F6
MLDAALVEKFRKIKLLSLDLDGTLTDGGLYYAEDGSELRKYHVQDGLGIVMCMKEGIEVCLLTLSNTGAIAKRAERLRIKRYEMGILDKLTRIRAFCTEMGIGLDEVAHVADDVNDLPLLRSIGLPIAVANARPEVKAVSAYVTQARGGDGAVREVCDLLLHHSKHVKRNPLVEGL